MLKSLHPGQPQQFAQDGFLFPIAALTAGEVARYRGFCEELDALLPRAPLTWRAQAHLHFRLAYDLATHPAILDAVEDLIGPDILVLSTILFAKPPNRDDFVSWHQDGRYLVREGGSCPPALTSWIALSDSSAENGCLRAIPGSHRSGSISHRFTYAADNMLLRGETLEADVDESAAVDFVMRAGQMSLHHVDLFHGSNANRSGKSRIGFTVRYAHPSVATSRVSGPVVLARGRDEFGHYQLRQGYPPDDFKAGLASLTEAQRLAAENPNSPTAQAGAGRATARHDERSR
jgi:non-heme Fe2+,alpha-ketoglutarate-dependent halogenase